MTDLSNEWKIGIVSFRDGDTYKDIDWMAALPLFRQQKTFTRSDGTMFSRVYERLTKRSRRKIDRSTEAEYRIPGDGLFILGREHAYRRGVKDTLEALRKELS
ncbi:hypothetical protein LCGC14_2365990 [marine sediment metagenome]|uniref:Uncharacterized protein n=1 Tax=marine sediment metagenome TaxID=412755 RepID=A0A0F9EZY7_9ZZZZ